jgi:steroid 5-alpha reductase family enzyme
MGVLLLRSAVALVAFFLSGFFVSKRVKNWSWVDVLWTFSFPLVCLSLLWHDHALADSRPFVALSLMYLVWSVRLGTHLSRRILRHHPEMEGRYLKLQSQWKDSENRSFLLFFLAQAFMSWVLATPIYLVAQSPAESRAWIAPALLWWAAFLGESIADRQLARFKAKAENKGKVCDVGLWGYSRHPNYFFEWLMWVAYALLAWATNPEWGWVAFVAPLFMLYLILKVTGVAPTEAQSLRSRGEAFRDYQKRVSVFVPWKPRKS